MNLHPQSSIPGGERRQPHWNSAQKTQGQTVCQRTGQKGEYNTEPTRTRLTGNQPAGDSTRTDSQGQPTAGEELGSPNRDVAGK